MIIQQIVNKMAANPKQLFLIDGLGAVLSAFLLGILLVQFETTFGMPRHILHGLAFMACIFAVYSFSCYLQIPKNWQLFLKIIAITNLIYCCLTIGLVFYYYSILTNLGVLYFFGELIVLIILICIELKTAVSK